MSASHSSPAKRAVSLQGGCRFVLNPQPSWNLPRFTEDFPKFSEWFDSSSALPDVTLDIVDKEDVFDWCCARLTSKKRGCIVY